MPSSPLVVGQINAGNILEALCQIPRVTTDVPNERAPVFWPSDEGELERCREFAVTDQRDWISGVHAGSRILKEGIVTLPPIAEYRS